MKETNSDIEVKKVHPLNKPKVRKGPRTISDHKTGRPRKYPFDKMSDTNSYFRTESTYINMWMCIHSWKKHLDKNIKRFSRQGIKEPKLEKMKEMLKWKFKIHQERDEDGKKTGWVTVFRVGKHYGKEKRGKRKSPAKHVRKPKYEI